MPRKQLDPINEVIDYFETTPIESAKTALEVAGAIIRRRIGKVMPAPAAAGRKTRTPRAAAPIAGPGPGPGTVG